MTLAVLGSRARVPTAHAQRCLHRLCSYWQHRFHVEHSDGRGIVQIPRDARGDTWPGDALIFLVAGVVDLEVRIEASCKAQLDAIQQAVARHLTRVMARGGTPLAIEWR